MIIMNKEKLRIILKIEQKQRRIEELERKMAQSDFWNDRKKAEEISEKYSSLKKEIEEFEKAESGEDLKKLGLKALLSGKYDQMSAILQISAGAGGIDAQDWAEMLLRMYLRFAKNKGWKINIIDKSRGTEAGIKSATVEIQGLYAYGYLKGEAGVHRLVRQSPFSANKLRHTSFALVDITPEIEKEEEIKIPTKDLRIDTFRARGPGGQSVNTTDSAVRITHLPSKISISVQNEKSQLQNKRLAMKILKSKLLKIKKERHLADIAKIKGETKQAAWGNQIRSYVLHPYRQVKDLRTGQKSKNVEAVLNGELEPFINSYLEKTINV